MKIGIFLGAITEEIGGGYTFQESVLRSLESLETTHEIFVFFYGNSRDSEASDRITYVSLSNHRRMDWIFRKVHALITGKTSSMLQIAAEYHQIEMVWFLTNFVPVDIPYICTVLDLEHRSHPFFPEVGTIDRWTATEQMYTSMIRRAAYVICGTGTGKRQVVGRYQIDEERVRILPFPVAQFAWADKEIPLVNLDKPALSRPYLFYPAQFWPHKNHVALLHALKLLREKYDLEFNLVFSGADRGNLSHVKEVSRELGMESHVRFLGFVSTDDLYLLYRNAFALVYPSMFGPDNLPPLEAFTIGCPVIAAMVTGAEEQLGDAVLYFHPRREEEIALAVKQMHENPDLRAHFIEKGTVRAGRWTASDYAREVMAIIDEFAGYRRCWSSTEKFQLA